MNPMTIRLSFAALAACLALSAPLAAEEHPPGMHVHDVYARIAPAGNSGAVFFMLHNNTDTDDRLVGARTGIAQKNELHTHLESADGVMQMKEIEGGVALPAGAMHEFARGGDHVMLMGLTAKPADGERFPLTLVFEQAGEVTVEAVVDNARTPEAGGHDHGAMHGEGHGDGHGAGHGDGHAAGHSQTD
jgi:copper(I)-binding protein